jgi:hypothetical protein
VSTLASPRITRGILDDSNKPAAQVAWLHPIEGSVGGDQPLLQGIVGVRGFARDPECHPPGKVQVGGEEGAEGLRVTRPCGAEEA